MSATGLPLYRCAGASCPGLPWPASAHPHPADCCAVLPHVTHEGAIEQAIGMFLPGHPEWNDLPQESRDRVWGALRWLVDKTHGIDAAPPFGPGSLADREESLARLDALIRRLTGRTNGAARAG